MLEVFLGVTFAVGVAGVGATINRQREAHIVDEKRFVTKMERIATSSGGHICEHCQAQVELDEIRLVYADSNGKLQVVCDRDSCLLAHTQGVHEQVAA